MVQLYPVKSVIPDASNAIHKSFNNKYEASTTYASKKCLRTPNRFTSAQYDRSICDFESDEEDEFCASLSSNSSDGKRTPVDCNCATCSPTPIVILAGPYADPFCRAKADGCSKEEDKEDEEEGEKEKTESSNFDHVNLRNVDEYIEGGLLRPIHERAFLISQQIHCNGQSITGIMAAIDVQDCVDNTVKRHERCVQDMQHKASLPVGSPRKERKRPPHRANSRYKKPLDPIIVMYRNSESVTELIQRIIETESPVYSSTSSQVSPLSGEFEEIQHRIWTIVGPADIEDLDRAFESIDSLYIADGHHRTAAACKAHCRASGDQGNEGESSEGSETDQDSEEDKGKPSQAWPPGIRYSPSSSRYISALLYSDAQMGVLSYNRCVTSIILPEEVKQAIEKKEKNRFSSDTINTIANEDISVDSIFIGVTETAARNSSLNSSQHSSQSQSSDDSNDHDSMESSEERLFMEEVSKEFIITPHSKLECCMETAGIKHSRNAIQQEQKHRHRYDWCKCRMYTNKCDLSMYINHKWYNISPIRAVHSSSSNSNYCSESLTAYNPLDSVSAQILSERLLVPTLRTDDPDSDNKVIYVDGREGLRGLMQRVDSGEAKVAFALERMSIAQIMEVADANQLLPAKATFFHPKPQTGVLLCLK